MRTVIFFHDLFLGWSSQYFRPSQIPMYSSDHFYIYKRRFINKDRSIPMHFGNWETTILSVVVVELVLIWLFNHISAIFWHAVCKSLCMSLLITVQTHAPHYSAVTPKYDFTDHITYPAIHPVYQALHTGHLTSSCNFEDFYLSQFQTATSHQPQFLHSPLTGYSERISICCTIFYWMKHLLRNLLMHWEGQCANLMYINFKQNTASMTMTTQKCTIITS